MAKYFEFSQSEAHTFLNIGNAKILFRDTRTLIIDVQLKSFQNDTSLVFFHTQISGLGLGYILH